MKAFLSAFFLSIFLMGCSDKPQTVFGITMNAPLSEIENVDLYEETSNEDLYGNASSNLIYFDKDNLVTTGVKTLNGVVHAVSSEKTMTKEEISKVIEAMIIDFGTPEFDGRNDPGVKDGMSFGLNFKKGNSTAYDVELRAVKISNDSDHMLVIRTAYTKKLYDLKVKEFEDIIKRLESKNK